MASQPLLLKTVLIPDATHIFDGLSKFPSHIAHLQLGTTPRPTREWSSSEHRMEDLFNLALEWIREDRDLRRIKEKSKGRTRGPRPETTDAKTFFEKYDYGN